MINSELCYTIDDVAKILATVVPYPPCKLEGMTECEECNNYLIEPEDTFEPCWKRYLLNEIRRENLNKLINKN